jgi:hypothetical protein
VDQLSLVISHRYRGPKHRNGTPGLVPYQPRVINPKSRPAQHRQRVARKEKHILLALATITAGVLLLLSGYRAAQGAAIVLSMF